MNPTDSTAASISPGVAAFDAGMHAFFAADNVTAEARFRAALAADPALVKARYMLGLTLLRLGKLDEAAAALRAVESSSDNPMLRDYASRKLAAIGRA